MAQNTVGSPGKLQKRTRRGADEKTRARNRPEGVKFASPFSKQKLDETAFLQFSISSQYRHWQVSRLAIYDSNIFISVQTLELSTVAERSFVLLAEGATARASPVLSFGKLTEGFPSTFRHSKGITSYRGEKEDMLYEEQKENVEEVVEKWESGSRRRRSQRRPAFEFWISGHLTYIMHWHSAGSNDHYCMTGYVVMTSFCYKTWSVPFVPMFAISPRRHLTTLGPSRRILQTVQGCMIMLCNHDHRLFAPLRRTRDLFVEVPSGTTFLTVQRFPC
ncbi:unnamed protein product [Nesidiocoris tenuis]|uniref:Uncharacterized protein n=1 Tax=Nesidiocoris tenuis TaxID=355587 RepID=A0A6H5GGQ4_9HEMI|nr:unnamed protein product [Nesidiocoris tenuis]